MDAAQTSATTVSLRSHLVWPFATAIVISILLETFSIDSWVADLLYQWEGNAWALKSHYLTENVLHKFGKMASLAAWLIVLVGYGLTFLIVGLKRLRRPLAYLLLTTVLASALISGLKSLSNMDCPWDLLRYGGDRAFVGLFETRPAGMARGVCFPAGHSSAGFAWLSLYFFLLVVRPAWRWYGLATGLLLGAVLGFGQQLRGAHFLSHDLSTMFICWLVALSGYWLVLRRPDDRNCVQVNSLAKVWQRDGVVRPRMRFSPRSARLPSLR